MKLDVADEFKMYRMANSEYTVKLMKHLMTSCTVLHFEAQNEEERLMCKGAALAMKAIVKGNQAVEQIVEKTNNPDEQVALWKKSGRIFKI